VPIDGDTLDFLREFQRQALDFIRVNLDTRFLESDLRYQQRFDAQQKAVGDALLAAEKAVNTALASADRAVVKAETAAEKRFESVNEFRAVLSNQSATLMPRTEADAQMKAMADKIEDLKSRVDRTEGGSKGIMAAAALAVAVVTAVFTVLHSPSPSPSLVPGQVGSQTTPIPPR